MAKKKKKTAAKRERIEIEYFCKDDKCKAKPRFAHLKKKANYVDMTAIDTDVDITFTAGSPFNETHIHIASGTTESREVLYNSGNFPYDLACSECPTKKRPALPPQMIVP